MEIFSPSNCLLTMEECGLFRLGVIFSGFLRLWDASIICILHNHKLITCCVGECGDEGDV